MILFKLRGGAEEPGGGLMGASAARTLLGRVMVSTTFFTHSLGKRVKINYRKIGSEIPHNFVDVSISN
jgi:hypothetical protein